MQRDSVFGESAFMWGQLLKRLLLESKNSLVLPQSWEISELFSFNGRNSVDEKGWLYIFYSLTC